MTRTDVRGGKVLFIGEGVTLAHVARPLVLGRLLAARQFDVAFAFDPRYEWVRKALPGEFHPIHTLDSTTFLRRVYRGQPVFKTEELRQSVTDDLRLLARARPDLVVGDFRLSLSVSARVAGVPYVAISNAYWSPYLREPRHVVPQLPWTRFLPIPVANAGFRLARPLAFAVHTRPLNKVRKEHRLSGLGFDLRRVYADADRVVFPDIPEMFPSLAAPPTHEFIGPVIWSAPVARPAWWSSIPDDRPVIYLTLGSSGASEHFGAVLDGLAGIPATVIAATAGHPVPTTLPKGVFVADFLPGDEATRRADLVVCNGGSSTTHQALAVGVPILGIAGNLDQLLNMEAVASLGAGVTMRVDRFQPAALQRLARSLLSELKYRSAAQGVARIFAHYDVGERFESVVRDTLGSVSSMGDPAAAQAGS